MPYVYDDANSWQQALLNNAMMREIITPKTYQVEQKD